MPRRGPFLLVLLFEVREVEREVERPWLFRGRPLLSGLGVSGRLLRRSFGPFLSLDLLRNFLAPFHVVR